MSLIHFLVLASASAGSARDGDAQRAQRLAGERFVRLQNLRAPLSRSKVAVSSPTSSCEQRASSTSGAPLVKTSTRSCRSASV